MDKIYLDQDGYENYLKELEQLREKIIKNSSDISEFMSDDAYGDGWHDNFAYSVDLNTIEGVIVNIR